MYEGQPLRISDFLPRSVRPEDFYTGLAAAVAFYCVVMIIYSFRQRTGYASKIKAIQERRKELQEGLTGPKKRRRPEASVNFMRSVVNRFDLIKKSQIGKSQSLLIEAGFRSKDAIYIVAFFNLVLPIVLGIVGFIIFKIDFGYSDKTKIMDYLWPIGGIYLGMKLPWIVVRRARKKRYLKIQRSLSDVLDLMTICAEAGLSLASMLDRVSRELAISYAEMAEELSLTSIEIGFLPDRNKALSNLAERCQLPEVRGIVSVLIQTEKYGTPIAQALRVLSSEFRQARMLRAEQKAARLPALMTIPMITCILPTLFIVIISPAIVKLLDTLAKN